METLTVAEVTQALRNLGLPEILLQTLKDNFIDGAALLLLPSDFTEFSLLVPQSGLRMKLKAAIDKLVETGPCLTNNELSLSDTGKCIVSSVSALNEFEMGDVSALAMDDMDLDYVESQNQQISAPIPSKQLDEASGEPEPKRKALENSKPILVKPEIDQQCKLPDPCPLPTTFSKKTLQAIESENLTGNAKTRLLREAALFYYGLCGVGSGNQVSSTVYVTMAKALCSQYPQLKDKKPVNGEYWDHARKYLSQKFRNMRRASEPSDGNQTNHSSKKRMSAADFAALPMPAEQEEDELAYKRNVQSLNEEYAKKTPNHGRIHHLLKLTHKTRRKNIEGSKVHSALIKEQYPYFGSKKWVVTEFCLMCGEDAVQKIENNLRKYAPKILECAGYTTIPDQLTETDMMSVLEAIHKCVKPSNAGTSCPSVISVHEPGSSIQDILKEKSFTEPRLVIFTNKKDMASSQGFICAEKVLFFEVPDFTIQSGIVSLIATYYCFYIGYPKPMAARMFLLFVQEILLEEPDVTGIRRSAKFTDFVNSLI